MTLKVSCVMRHNEGRPLPCAVRLPSGTSALRPQCAVGVARVARGRGAWPWAVGGGGRQAGTATGGAPCRKSGALEQLFCGRASVWAVAVHYGP